MLVSKTTASIFSFLPFLLICYYGDVKYGIFGHPSWKNWGNFTPQHQTHTRHKNYLGERSTHQKWDSKEEIFWYTQHRGKNFNTIAKIHWESDMQFWQPSSHQTSHCMVQPQETAWRCISNEKNSLYTTFVSSYQERTKLEHSKHGRTFPSMTDTGDN